MKIVVVSGGFDPIHSGHIAYLEEAKKLGDTLIVALNSDDWLIKKKEKFFMPFSEREIILKNLKPVDDVISFEDDELGSCIDALNKIKLKYNIFLKLLLELILIYVVLIFYNICLLLLHLFLIYYFKNKPMVYFGSNALAS